VKGGGEKTSSNRPCDLVPEQLVDHLREVLGAGAEGDVEGRAGLEALLRQFRAGQGLAIGCSETFETTLNCSKRTILKAV
jgi:hypothetical protein